MGLLYVAASLEQDGHEVEVIDGEADDLTPEKMLQAVEKSKPDIVGAGATTVDFEYANALLKQVKEKLGIQTVIGGPHSTIMPTRVLEENPHIDFAVRGEGEITARELVKELAAGKNFSKVDGLSFRKGDKIVNNRERELIPDLDSLPRPARRLVDQKKYLFPVPYRGMELVSEIQTSRGCPQKCVFCYRMFGMKLRLRSVKSVVDEIEYCVKELGVKFISFADDTLTIVPKRLIEICDEIIARKIKVHWFGLSRADKLNEEIIKKMKSAGCVMMSIGVESGSQEILDSMKKGTTLEQCRESIRLLKKHGFVTRASFIMGLPGEDRRTLRKTIDFAKDLALDRAFFNIFTPYPGTPLFEMAERGEGGVQLLTHNWKDFTRSGNAVINLGDIDSEELMEWQKIAMMEFYARPRIIFNHLLEFIRGERAWYYYRPFFFGLKEFYKRKLRFWTRKSGAPSKKKSK